MTIDTLGSGWKEYRSISVLATGLLVQGARTRLGGYYVSNTGAATAFLKFYDKATAGAATDTPVMTLAIPAASAANLMLGPGVQFDLGLSVRAVTGVADADTTAVGANEVIVNLFYF